jgi:hypothetical protein
MIAQISKPHPTRRTSSNSVWPLRRADGTKLYERPATIAQMICVSDDHYQGWNSPGADRTNDKNKIRWRLRLG